MSDSVRELNNAELGQIAGAVLVGGGGRDPVEAPIPSGGGGSSKIPIGLGGRDWPVDPIVGLGDWWIMPVDPVIPVPKPDPGKP